VKPQSDVVHSRAQRLANDAGGVMTISLMTAGLVVIGMRNSDAGSRVGLLKRRRDNAGELGDQEQGDQ
jgi:hypothetical protein